MKRSIKLVPLVAALAAAPQAHAADRIIVEEISFGAAAPLALEDAAKGASAGQSARGRSAAKPSESTTPPMMVLVTVKSDTSLDQRIGFGGCETVCAGCACGAGTPPGWQAENARPAWREEG